MPLEPLWRVGDVRAVEGGGEDGGVRQFQPLDDVVAGMRISRRRQRHARHAGIIGGELAQFPVFRAKIMAPLRNAMSLVDGEQRDLRAADQLTETRRHDTLGRDIEKIERAVADGAADVEKFLAAKRGIQRGGVDPDLLQRLHLIAHQRDQRRNDDADAIAAERRNLEAERLARPGREKHDGIAARNHLLDHRRLLAAK